MKVASKFRNRMKQARFHTLTHILIVLLALAGIGKWVRGLNREGISPSHRKSAASFPA